MHLKQLKIAGFKSFVDPTIVPIPSHLVAVVGPNGCGKSNIIDAVRWVMGESSAKNLRGESMTDVIFNGSSQRKALGQASVELIFDNSLGRLTGQFAGYQELSVKRLVTRGGDSGYFLNGSRCRRRDITDIFLGTGAGARGYSIIGQGTISRIVEARPEELRAYLEEAAGISKYKERRRETKMRIDHTRENLVRVADVREELTKQLQRLERQAKTAERYKSLKAQERHYKAEILALKWLSLTNEQKNKQNEIHQVIIRYEKHQAEVTEAYKVSTVLREKLHEGNERFQQTQACFYQLATDIARLEENIQQQQREKQRLLSDQQQMQVEKQKSDEQLELDKKLLLQSEAAFIELGHQLETIETILHAKEETLREKQDLEKSWNVKTDDVNTGLNQAIRDLQAEELRLQHHAERRQQMMSRLEKINNELASIDCEKLEESLKVVQETLVRLREQVQIHESHYQQIEAQESEIRLRLTDTEQKLHQTRDKIHLLTTQQATLQAYQQDRSGQAVTLEQWANKPRLVENIKVDKEWQLACEKVLATSLQAVVLDSFDELWLDVEGLQGSTMQFVGLNSSTVSQTKYPSLAEKLSGSMPSGIYNLAKIYTASSFAQALEWLSKLEQEESIITKEGHWLGPGWARFAGSLDEEEQGLFARQEELTNLAEELKSSEEELAMLKFTRDDLYQQIKENEQQLKHAKQNLILNREDLSTALTEQSQQERILAQTGTRKNTLIKEQEELANQLEELAALSLQSEQSLIRYHDVVKEYQEQQTQLLALKASWVTALQDCRQAVDETRTTFNQTQLQKDREQLKIQQFHDRIHREQARLAQLNENWLSCTNRLLELEEPDARQSETLREKIGQHTTLEALLTQQREQLSQQNTELTDLELRIRTEEKQAKLMQDMLSKEQLQEQALAVRAAGVIETLSEFSFSIDDLLTGIPSEVTQELREQELQDIVDKINRLGSINLAAIDEYETEFERKQHLDKQYDDLMEALATLERAIEKLDKETEQRLRTTFDEVNTAFQALFPRLFGGGRAMLELTCDNLLEAGILVMAQPPGKRNSTIHLLSGGEKAMTAVALVFAIFQLNPSPFCMLDEVDAPLDDVNVGRFCELVKEMSQAVQFLFITHNKVTMELAEQLIGVTMREPGVSRIVAVDVEQALAMSET